MAKASAVADDPTVVYLGNRDAIEVLRDPDDDTKVVRSKIDGPKKNCTTILLGTDERGKPLTLMQAAQQITDPTSGVWQAHSDAEKPAWVAVSGPLAAPLSQLLGAHWGIEVREPEPATGSEG